MKFTDVVLISSWDREGGRKEGIHTESIGTNVVTGETVAFRKVAGMKRTKVEEILHTLPH